MAENTENTAKAEAQEKNLGPVRQWIKDHPNIWEFILFNLLSNISTATRFVLLWILPLIFVNAMGMTSPFHWFFYNYTSAQGGVGYFICVLIAEVLAQTVNFIVQFKLVFKPDSNARDAAWKYIVLAIIIIIISGVAPSYIQQVANNWGIGGWGSTLTAVFNTLMAVVVSYPLLKFWIMSKSGNKSEETADKAE